MTKRKDIDSVSMENRYRGHPREFLRVRKIRRSNREYLVNIPAGWAQRMGLNSYHQAALIFEEDEMRVVPLVDREHVMEAAEASVSMQSPSEPD